MRDQKHAALIIALCIGLFSFLASLIISKYGPEMLVMGIGLFSIALVSVSLMLLWKSMAEKGDDGPMEDEVAPQTSVMAPTENAVGVLQETHGVHESKSPEDHNIGS